MSSSTISYKTILKNLVSKEKLLHEKHNLTIPKDSWYWEAIELLKMVMVAIDKKEKLNSKEDEDYWNRVFTSLGLLQELSRILKVLDTIDEESLEIFISKLRTVFKGPLLMIDEDENSNMGRNTLFELDLFSRLIKNGYKARLHHDHPDISFQVEEREYVIECKRIYKPETLVKNARVAVSQLTTYSLEEPKPEGIYARYGIVAISLSRYIHTGDKLFEAKSEEAAAGRIRYELEKIFNENKEELLRKFPVNIPALFLQYSDRGSIDMPYTYNFIDVHDTATGSFSNYKHVARDLERLDD